MAHTSGTASDVIDDTSSPKADVTATMPIKGVLPGNISLIYVYRFSVHLVHG